MTLKLGKLPARPDSIKFKMGDYWITLPKPPPAFGHQTMIDDWGMLGNDQYGDCVLAGGAHETMLWNKEAGKVVPFSEQSVLSDYSAITGFNPNDPNSDQGTDMQAAASYRRKVGLLAADNTRHQVAAYMALRKRNVADLTVAIYLFSAVGIGIEVPSSAMDQFNAGQPWTVVKNSPIEGGHYVPAVAYDRTYIYVVTWGKIQPMAWSFLKTYNDESVAYLSTEMLVNNKSLEGFDLKTLQSDLSKL